MQIFFKDTWFTDPKQKANLFIEQFCKVFSNPTNYLLHQILPTTCRLQIHHRFKRSSQTPPEHLFTYKIHGINLQTQNSAKYLGVTLDSKLDWSEHCDSIYNKACFMLAFLERNVHKCPRHVKENCFNALVRPLVEYASCVWDPHKQTQIDKLEKN